MSKTIQPPTRPKATIQELASAIAAQDKLMFEEMAAAKAEHREVRAHLWRGACGCWLCQIGES